MRRNFMPTRKKTTLAEMLGIPYIREMAEPYIETCKKLQTTIVSR
jgi:hypothetical protein